MTSRACWLTVATVALALWLGVGLLLAPPASASHPVIAWVPPWLMAAGWLATAAMGVAATGAHHAGARGMAMHLTRAMAIIGGMPATVWLIGHLAAWAAGDGMRYEVIGPGCFVVWMLLEATGMGGRRE